VLEVLDYLMTVRAEVVEELVLELEPALELEQLQLLEHVETLGLSEVQLSEHWGWALL
jgi:hypothetical protein